MEMAFALTLFVDLAVARSTIDRPVAGYFFLCPWAAFVRCAVTRWIDLVALDNISRRYTISTTVL